MKRARWMFVVSLIVLLTSAAWAVNLNESFDETLFPPVAWQSFEDGDGTTIWIRTTGSAYLTLGKAETTKETLVSPQVAQRWLITPKLRVNSSADTLAFWVRVYLAYTNDDSLYVRLSTGDSLAASFTNVLASYKLGTSGQIGTTYLRFALPLTPYVGQDVFIAFLHRDIGTGGHGIYLDSLTGPELKAPPKVAKTPSPANLAYGVAANANLGWVNGIGTSTVDLYLAQTYDSVNTSNVDAKKLSDSALATLYNPPDDLIANQRYYWKVVNRNAYGETVGPIWTFWVAGAPLSGSYDIGGLTPNYTNFTDAVAALYGNGISDAVTFNVYGGDYNEQLRLIGAVPGANAGDTIKFRDASTTARLRVSLKLDSQEGVVQMNGASYFIFDGIDFYLDQAGDSTYKCFVMTGGSSYNIVRNADMRGAGFSASTIKYVCYMWGTANTNNLFDNLTCHRHNTAFYITGSSAQRHSNNVIRNCSFYDIWNGFYLSYTTGIRIYDNDIQINGAGAASGYGVEVYTQASGDTVFIYRNKFHNIVASGSPSFVHAYGGAGTILNVYNNWVYDIQTTGSASPYVALYANTAGTTNFDFNSVRINDVASTGTVCGIYMAGSTAILNIRNNIFYSAEASVNTYIFYGMSAGYVPTSLDYNAYYNAAGNLNYQVYRVSSTGYTTLAALQAATVYEDHGVEGNPGFTSATDLHIQNTFNLVSNNGLPIAGIGDDFDAQARSGSNPDIGADEYTYLAPPADYAVTEMLNVIYLNPELTLKHPWARVVNRGSAAQTNAPVVLFYSGTPQDTVLVSLAVDEIDTIAFDWTTPAAPQTGTLEAQSFLDGDADLTNDSVLFAVRIVGQPMHDTYDIGGGDNDYSNFTSAVADLTLRGMDGAVIFDVYGTTYTDSLVMGPITGATATYTITFQEHVTALDEPVKITHNRGSGTVRLNGADYVTIDGIDIEATGATNLRCVYISGNADYNTIKNCTITGPSVSLTTTYGVQLATGGNDYNTFDHLTVSGACYGISLAGVTGTVDIGNEVKNCSVTEAKYGLATTYQRGGRVHDCDVQPGWTAANVDVYGLYALSQNAGDTVFYYNNRIHNIRTSSSVAYASNGIYTVASPARFYNNFIWDFQGTGIGAIHGIRVFGGSPEIYFNSVHIGDVATTGNAGLTAHINGFFEITAGSSAILKNNIFQIDEPTDSCFAINRNAGTLVSDYNCVYSSGPGAKYFMGRSGTTNYLTLAAWQAATVYDDSSVEGNPGYSDVGAGNLHILATYDLVDSEGVAIAGISTDIDGNVRAGVPDIGADEYLYFSYLHDYGIVGFIGLLPTYTGTVLDTIQAEVKNNGSNNETNVPVVLYYEGVPQDTVLLSLLSLTSDTVDFVWTPPAAECTVGELKAKAFCPSDGYAANDSMTAEVNVIGGPMSGTYDLGGGSMDFATFADALECLYLRGVDGETIIDVYGGSYTENVILVGPITGASFTDRVIFRAHQSPLLDVVTLTSNINTPCVRFSGVDYVTFDGIDMVGTVGCDTVVSIINDADFITLKNLRVTGRDSTIIPTKGIKVGFDGNDDCLIDNVTITGVFYGIRGEGGSGQSDRLEVKNCHISGASYCVYLDDLHNARVHDNDLQPHGYAATSTYGVYVASLTSGDTAYVYNNRIHNLRHTLHTSFPTVAGIYSGSGQTVYIFNNFIWDWQTDGPDIYGVYASNGATYCGFNTIRMNDVANAGDFVGLYVTTGTTHTLQAANNIIVMEETADTCYGIWRLGGTLTASDYNCFRGVSPNYYTGRSGATTYATLADWQVLGYDSHSVAGDPGFVAVGDLHIDSTYLLVNNVGLYVAEVQTDIDGDVRNDPPDIGADEYHGLIMPDVVDSLTIFPDAATGNVLLRWTPSAEANSYKIYRGTTVGFVIDGSTYVNQTAATTYTDVGALSLGVRIFYVVIASTDPIAR